MAPPQTQRALVFRASTAAAAPCPHFVTVAARPLARPPPALELLSAFRDGATETLILARIRLLRVDNPLRPHYVPKVHSVDTGLLIKRGIARFPWYEPKLLLPSNPP